MRGARSVCTLVIATGVALSLASEAAAQQRGGRGRHRHNHLVARYSYGYWPSYGFYHGGFWPYHGFGVPYAYPTGSARAELRVQVKPADTQVYVDGYYAGTADDFDGLFQRLHLPPGQHTLELYLDGHRTARQSLYVSPGASYKIRFEMAGLEPGDEPPTRPRPIEPAATTPPRHSSAEPPPRPAVAGVAGFGVLELRSKPGRAEVWVDGERWPESGEEELVLHLPTGRHSLEVRRDGHETFSAEVEVRRGETTRLNVMLPRSR